MGVRIISRHTRELACLYCSTSGWAFGPVFDERNEHDSYERAEAFCRWLPKDARKYSDSELSQKYSEWLSQEDEQFKNEEGQ